METHLIHRINWESLKKYITPYNNTAIQFPCCSCNKAIIDNNFNTYEELEKALHVESTKLWINFLNDRLRQN